MKNISILWAIAFVAGLAAAHFSPVRITIAMAVLVAWTLRGAEECIRSLTLATLLTYLSSPIAEFPSEAGMLSRVLLMVAAVRVLPLLRAREARLLWPVWV